MGFPAEEVRQMDGDTIYKGYTIRQIGAERMSNGMRLKTYAVSDKDGNGVAKAWGMTEAKAIVNADIRGEL